MNPTIQLIQLTVRFEREEQAQRRSFMTHRNGRTNEKSVSLLKLNNWFKHIFNSPRPQQCCQCA